MKGSEVGLVNSLGHAKAHLVYADCEGHFDNVVINHEIDTSTLTPDDRDRVDVLMMSQGQSKIQAILIGIKEELHDIEDVHEEYSPDYIETCTTEFHPDYCYPTIPYPRMVYL